MLRHLNKCHPAELQRSIDDSTSKTDHAVDEDFKQESADECIWIEEDDYNQEMLETDLKVESQEPNSEAKEQPNEDEERASRCVGARLGLGGRTKSAIWDYFVRIDKFTVSCNTCKNEVRSHETTTSLRNHLLHNHKEVHAEYKERRLRELKQHYQAQGLEYQETQPESGPKKRTGNYPASKSAVWQYFSKRDGDKVNCNICHQEFPSHGMAPGSLQRYVVIRLQC